METNQSNLQANMPTNTEHGGKRLEGLGGWMILIQAFVFFELIGVAIVLFGEFLPLLASGNLASTQEPILKTAIILQFVASIVFFVMLVMLVVLMYKKKKAFPKLMITLLIMTFLVAGLVYGLVKQVVALDGISEKEYIQPISQAIILCCIGIPYLIRSKRVKNTFVN